MSEWRFNSIFPQRFWPDEKPAKYDQIIIFNWLQIEVPLEKQMPVLNSLSHWRNYDVYCWVQEHKDEYYLRMM